MTEHVSIAKHMTGQNSNNIPILHAPIYQLLKDL